MSRYFKQKLLNKKQEEIKNLSNVQNEQIAWFS